MSRRTRTRNAEVRTRKPEPAAPAPAGPHGIMAVLREWSDALVVAFVATMFLRIFYVELYKIPSSSMTPTLIGGRIAELDVDGDGRNDIILFGENGTWVFTADGKQFPATPGIFAMLQGRKGRERFDRILVNKMSYWFHPPRRGDVAVFKVPEKIWKGKEMGIYIKRVAGLPGETIEFDGDGHLMAEGRRVSGPEFFERQAYQRKVDSDLPEASYDESGRIQSIHVPEGQLYMFGDNTNGSYDSRFWGGVPVDNVKGRAFFRYWPPSKMRFFEGS